MLNTMTKDYRWFEDGLLWQIDRSISKSQNHFLWKEASANIKDNLSWALSILASDPSIINQLTCNGWDSNNNDFLIWQLWQKKKKAWLLWGRSNRKIERIEKQKQKTTKELRENYNAVCSNKELKELENVKAWIIYKEKTNSYERDEDYFDAIDDKKQKYNEWDMKLKRNMKSFQLDNIMFNHIFEHIIRDLIEDIIKEKNIEEGVKIIKTNEYDDVRSNTDYIIELDLWGEEEAFRTIDITTISNDDGIYAKEQQNTRPILFDYSTVKWKIVKELTKKDVWSIDKNFAFNLTNNYINIIKKWKRIQSWKCLELAKKISEADVRSISHNISASISDVLKN